MVNRPPCSRCRWSIRASAWRSRGSVIGLFCLLSCHVERWRVAVARRLLPGAVRWMAAARQNASMAGRKASCARLAASAARLFASAARLFASPARLFALAARLSASAARLSGAAARTCSLSSHRKASRRHFFGAKSEEESLAVSTLSLVREAFCFVVASFEPCARDFLLRHLTFELRAQGVLLRPRPFVARPGGVLFRRPPVLRHDTRHIVH